MAMFWRSRSSWVASIAVALTYSLGGAFAAFLAAALAPLAVGIGPIFFMASSPAVGLASCSGVSRRPLRCGRPSHIPQ